MINALIDAIVCLAIVLVLADFALSEDARNDRARARNAREWRRHVWEALDLAESGKDETA